MARCYLVHPNMASDVFYQGRWLFGRNITFLIMVVLIVGDNSTAGTMVTSACHDRTDLIIVNSEGRSFGKTYIISNAFIEDSIYAEPLTPKFHQNFHALQVCFKGKQLHNWNLNRSSKINKRIPMKDKRINRRKNFIKQLNRKLYSESM